MFDQFGNFESAEEINLTAVNLRREKDYESIKALTKENGIDEEIAECFIAGDLIYLADDMTAALGKIEIEAAELKPEQIMVDWVEYIKVKCFDDAEMARGVRKKDKTLKGCIAKILMWAFKNQMSIDKEILKAAGVTGSCTLGIPGMAEAYKIIGDYYRK